MQSISKLKSKSSKTREKTIYLISQLSLIFLQLKHDLAFLTRNDGRISLFEAFVNQWRILLSGESPKGFDKSAKKSAEPEGDKTAKSDETTKPPAASKSSSDTKPPPDWNFGMFSPNPSAGPKSQGQGRPIGGEQPPDQTRMLVLGALGFITFIGALTYFEMGYKEISWKEFVNK